MSSSGSGWKSGWETEAITEPEIPAGGLLRANMGSEFIIVESRKSRSMGKRDPEAPVGPGPPGGEFLPGVGEGTPAGTGRVGAAGFEPATP